MNFYVIFHKTDLLRSLKKWANVNISAYVQFPPATMASPNLCPHPCGLFPSDLRQTSQGNSMRNVGCFG